MVGGGGGDCGMKTAERKRALQGRETQPRLLQNKLLPYPPCWKKMCEYTNPQIPQYGKTLYKHALSLNIWPVTITKLKMWFKL